MDAMAVLEMRMRERGGCLTRRVGFGSGSANGVSRGTRRTLCRASQLCYFCWHIRLYIGFSVVAAAIAAPLLVKALTGALAVPIGLVGKWCNMLWNNYERGLKGQREIISSMQIGTFVAMKDLDNIRVLVDKFEFGIESLLHNADFAIREESVAMKLVIDEIKKKLDLFVETIDNVSQHADKSNQNIRAVILHRIIRHPDQ